MIKVVRLPDASGGPEPVFCPVVCCDSCGRQIDSPLEGPPEGASFYHAEADDPGPYELYAAHMGTCAFALRQQKGWPERVSHFPLKDLPRYLAINLGASDA